MPFSADVGHLVAAGPLLLAAPVALAAGLLSFFSPCCLPLVPGYLSYVSGLSGAETGIERAWRPEALPPAQPQGASIAARMAARGGGGVGVVALPRRIRPHPAEQRRGSRRVVVGAGLFVLGFAAVFVSYGAAFGGAGFVLQSHPIAVRRALGTATILLGLMFAGFLARVPLLRASSYTRRLGYRPSIGLSGAPLLGALFAVGWTPCIGPTLGAVLLLSSQDGTATRGAFLGLVYALGLGIPFLLVAAAFSRAMRAVQFARRHATAVMRVGGIMLITVGVLQLTGEWAHLVAKLQGVISGTTLPL